MNVRLSASIILVDECEHLFYSIIKGQKPTPVERQSAVGHPGSAGVSCFPENLCLKGKDDMEYWPPFGCLLVTHLPLRLALRQHPGLQETPVAITTPGQRGTLIDCSRRATEFGLKPGMLAREAQTLCPQVTILPDDPLAYAAEHTALMQALADICPTLQRGPVGRINLDLRGLQRHYTSPDELGQTLLGVARADLKPRISMAPSVFTAFIAARGTRPGGARVITPEDVGHLLEHRPIDLLPLPLEMLTRMERLGLQRIPDIVRLPLTTLVAQFGNHGKRAWQLARGEDPDPFIPEPILEPVIEVLPLPAPTALEHELAVALRVVAGRLLARPELRGRAVRRLRLDLQLGYGGTVGRTFVVKEGTRDPRRLVSLMRSQLGNLPLDAAVAAIQLELLDTGEQAPQQVALGEDASRSVARLRGAVAELSQRYETSPLYQIVEVNRWARLPEHRWALAVYEP